MSYPLLSLLLFQITMLPTLNPSALVCECVCECVCVCDIHTHIASLLFRASSMREVHAHAVLGKHQHIVQYFSAWAEQKHMIIQNEYCNGGNSTQPLIPLLICKPQICFSRLLCMTPFNTIFQYRGFVASTEWRYWEDIV